MLLNNKKRYEKILRIFKELGAILTLGVCVVVGCLVSLEERFFTTSLCVVKQEVILSRGTSLKILSRHLYEKQVISSAFLFEWGMKARRLFVPREHVQAGEYMFEGVLTPVDVFEKMVKGQVLVRSLTIPEGLTTREILTLIEAAPSLLGDDIRTQAYEEGSLLPETYAYQYPYTKQELLDRMRQAHATLIAQLWQNRAPDLPLNSMHEAVTLASIVEKETARGIERPRVAAVFVNRLKEKMPLQSDPTVLYGLFHQTGQELGRALTRADLKELTPYNTYMIQGLPPAPICHPGKSSLEAVLHPMESRDLYFVADGTGGHAFSQTYEEHKRRHEEWRVIRDKAAR